MTVSAYLRLNSSYPTRTRVPGGSVTAPDMQPKVCISAVIHSITITDFIKYETKAIRFCSYFHERHEIILTCVTSITLLDHTKEPLYATIRLHFFLPTVEECLQLNGTFPSI